MFSFPLHARPLLTHFLKELWSSRWGSSSRPRLCPVKYVRSASGSRSQEKLQCAAHGLGFILDRLASEKQHAGFTSCPEDSQGLQSLWKILRVTVLSSHINQNVGIILPSVVLSEIQGNNPGQTSHLCRSKNDSDERANNIVAPEHLDYLGSREGFAEISEVTDKHFHVCEGLNCFLKPNQELNSSWGLTHLPPCFWSTENSGA